MDFVAVPKDFLKLHKFVTLVAYVIFVNGAPFLITMPCGIKYVTVKHIQTHTAKQLSKYLKQFMKIYSISSMILHTVFLYMDFNKTID